MWSLHNFTNHFAFSMADHFLQLFEVGQPPVTIIFPGNAAQEVSQPRLFWVTHPSLCNNKPKLSFWLTCFMARLISHHIYIETIRNQEIHLTKKYIKHFCFCSHFSQVKLKEIRHFYAQRIFFSALFFFFFFNLCSLLCKYDLYQGYSITYLKGPHMLAQPKHIVKE